MIKALIATAALVALMASAALASDFRAERQEMVDTIKRIANSISGETGHDKLDPRVLEALRDVPRHEFVPASLRTSAYRNRPLPIGHGQTISQPAIVALMTDLLRLKPTDTVLEVGTGSGYQAAILSKLAKEVYSIEIVRELGETAAGVLARLGHTNVTTKIGDGYEGWAEHAPYDAIIVTAAPDHIPSALVEQLKPEGRMVIPVGGQSQDLIVVRKKTDGTTINTTVVPVRFVPLVRE